MTNKQNNGERTMNSTMIKHYVTFYSPGTFVPEQTTNEIESWDIQKALAMLSSINERYNARPYCFSFHTRERGENDFEPVQTKRSGFHFIGGNHGRYFTLNEVIARNDAKDKTLIENMKCNRIDVIYETLEGWKVSIPVGDNDKLVSI
jgi:hypothetical protein